MPSRVANTAIAVVSDREADTSETIPIDDEKHKSTTRASSGSRPVADDVVGGRNLDGSSDEKTHSTEHPLNVSRSSAHDNSQREGVVSTKENVAVATGEQKEGKDGVNVVEGDGNGEEDDEVEVVCPGGLQLGLLTFGLCMATFTVALGKTWSFPCAFPRTSGFYASMLSSKYKSLFEL